MKNILGICGLAIGLSAACGGAQAQENNDQRLQREAAQRAEADYQAEYEANRNARAARESRPTYEEAWMPAYTAMATWAGEDGREAFFTATSPESAESAREAALNDCAAEARRASCDVKFMIEGGYFAVARAPDGRVMASRGRDEAQARRDAARDCRRAFSASCEVEFEGRSEHFGMREVSRLPGQALDLLSLGATIGLLNRRR